MPDSSKAYQVGRARVTRIQDTAVPGAPARTFLPDWDPAADVQETGWMVPDYLDETRQHLSASVHSWLVQTPRYTLLIDTGVGNAKPRTTMAMFDHLDTPYLARLEAAGVRPEDVDHVLLTHLHADHVGWNTRLVGGRWTSTFPNARFLLSRREQERQAALLERLGSDAPEVQAYADSVQPILRQAELFGSDGGEILEGLTLHLTPGHSADHRSPELVSDGERAFFVGDVLHHPMQVYVPAWSSVFSEDKARGRQSRLWALEHAAANGALVFSSHFSGTSAGRVIRRGDTFGWEPA